MAVILGDGGDGGMLLKIVISGADADASGSEVEMRRPSEQRGKLLTVRGDQDGRPAGHRGQVLEVRPDLGPQQRVDPHRGLIEHQQLRVVHQRAGLRTGIGRAASIGLQGPIRTR